MVQKQIFSRIVLELDVKSQTDKKIDLGNVIVSTALSEMLVTFRCEYPVEVSVASETFTVNDVSAVGTRASTGSLAEGFDISTGANHILGNTMDVDITWSLSFSDISFYIDECRVEQGELTVEVVKEGCYSEALKAAPTSPIPSAKQASLKFISFNIEGGETDKQFIICKIRICTELCDNPTTTDQCPATEHFSYTVSGYHE